MTILRRISVIILLAPVALLAAIARAAADEIRRAEELLSQNWYLDMNLLEGGELLELARRPAVREWMRQSIRDQVSAEEPEGQSALYRLEILLAAAGGEEEVKLLAETVARSPKLRQSLLGYLARPVLERAAFSISPAIESQLLPHLAQTAAETLEEDLACALWLAGHRFPAIKMRSLLESAWKKAWPSGARAKKASSQNHPHALVEVQVLGPDGKPLEFPGWAQSLGSWSPSQAMLWPDGKLRFRHYLDPGKKEEELTLRPAMFGFRESRPSAVKLQPEKVIQHTITLAERRPRIKGKLEPAPKAPLFARHLEEIPLGSSPGHYREYRGELVAPIRPDGSFEVPASSRGRSFIVYTLDGDVFLAKEVSPPDQDLDLGTISLPAGRDLVSIPIEIDWPREIPKPRELSATISWHPTAIGSPQGFTACSLSLSGRGPEKGPFRFGLARNLPPREYNLKVKFSQEKESSVEDLELPFTVKDFKSPLLLKPRLKPGFEPPAPSNPGVPAAPAAVGGLFRIVRGARGEIHLVSSGGSGLQLLSRKEGAFGPPSPIFNPPRSSRGHLSDLDLHAAENGDLHVFLLLLEREFFDRLLYARVTPSKAKNSSWIAIADRNSPLDCFELPSVIARPKDVLEIYTPVMAARQTDPASGDLEDKRILCGFLEKGKYRHLRSLRTDSGPFALLSFNAKVFAASRGEPQALFFADGLAWTGLKRAEIRPAASLPRRVFISRWKAITSPEGAMEVVIPIAKEKVDGEGNRKTDGFRYWAARGSIGGALQELGELPVDFPGENFSLARSPDGKAYLVSVLPSRGGKEKRQIALWNLSGPFPPEAIYTPWHGEIHSEPRAVFTGPGEAVVAWNDGGNIHAEAFALPENR